MSIEFYLYAIATEQYELVTLIDLKYSTGTGHCYYGKANLMIGDTIYEDDHTSLAFYFGEAEEAVIVLFEGENGKLRTHLRLK